MKDCCKKIMKVIDDYEMMYLVNKIMYEKNYNSYDVGPLHTEYENGIIVDEYDVHFYDNDGNVVEVIAFKFE
jgi:hypothetical protein